MAGKSHGETGAFCGSRTAASRSRRRLARRARALRQLWRLALGCKQRDRTPDRLRRFSSMWRVPRGRLAGSSVAEGIVSRELRLPAVEVVDEIPPEVLPAVVAQLAALQARAAARMAGVLGVEPVPASETLLSVAEAAQRMNVSKDWIYRHARSLPFVHRVGRSIRIGTRGMDKWLATRRACRR